MRHRENARAGLRSCGFGVVFVVATSTSGCYKATFIEDASTLERRPTHEEWTDHYLFGMIGTDEYDLGQWCPNGVAIVRRGGSFATGVVTLATLGIYSPRKVYVTCRGPRVTAALELDP